MFSRIEFAEKLIVAARERFDKIFPPKASSSVGAADFGEFDDEDDDVEAVLLKK